jgi:hypothetical protein
MLEAGCQGLLEVLEPIVLDLAAGLRRGESCTSIQPRATIVAIRTDLSRSVLWRAPSPAFASSRALSSSALRAHAAPRR